MYNMSLIQECTSFRWDSTVAFQCSGSTRWWITW